MPVPDLDDPDHLAGTAATLERLPRTREAILAGVRARVVDVDQVGLPGSHCQRAKRERSHIQLAPRSFRSPCATHRDPSRHHYHCLAR